MNQLETQKLFFQNWKKEIELNLIKKLKKELRKQDLNDIVSIDDWIDDFAVERGLLK